MTEVYFGLGIITLWCFLCGLDEYLRSESAKSKKKRTQKMYREVEDWLLKFYTKQCGNEIPDFMNKLIYYSANQELVQMAQDGHIADFYKRIKAGAV